MIRILTLLITFLITTHTLAGINEKVYGSILVDEITSIYDGDTFRVKIDSWPEIAGERVPVRILGIDTPELRTKCESEKALARKAKQFTVAKLRGAKSIELRDMRRGKYFVSAR